MAAIVSVNYNPIHTVLGNPYRQLLSILPPPAFTLHCTLSYTLYWHILFNIASLYNNININSFSFDKRLLAFVECFVNVVSIHKHSRNTSVESDWLYSLYYGKLQNISRSNYNFLRFKQFEQGKKLKDQQMLTTRCRQKPNVLDFQWKRSLRLSNGYDRVSTATV